jgi:mannosyltransferase
MVHTVTSPTMPRATRLLWAAPVIVGTLALAISLIGLGTPSVWYDEVATVSASTRSVPQLWALLGNMDAVHGAYYALMHLVFEILGYTPVTLRLPSAVFVAVTAGLVVILGRRIGGPLLGIASGIAFAILPRVTWMAAEGRSYALSAMLAVILTLVLFRATADNSRRWWLAYSAVAIVGCVSFIYLGVLVAAHGVGMLVPLLRSEHPTGRANARRMLGRWVASAAIAGVFVLPFMALVSSQSSQLPAMSPIGVQTVTEVAVSQWFGTSIPCAVVGLALAVFGLAMFGQGPGGRERPEGRGILIASLVVPTTALLAAALANPGIYQPRYLSMCAPFIAIAIAMGVVRIRIAPLAVASVALLVALAVPQFVSQRQPESKKDASWSTVAEYIQQQRAEHEGPTAIVFGEIQPHHGASARVISYAYPKPFVGAVDVTLGTPAAETGELWESRLPLAATLDRLGNADNVYLITTEGAPRRESSGELLRRAGWVPRELWTVDTVTVVRYDRSLLSVP